MTCRTTAPLLDAFLDGELPAEKVLEVEQHLGECRTCVERVRLGQALRGSLRRSIRLNTEPSEAFRARLASALEAAHEREWEVGALERQIDRSRMLSWRTILPVAAAAALTLAWAASTDRDAHRAQRISSSYASADSTNVDELIEELVNYHAHERSDVVAPAVVPTTSLLPEFEREVGVPVHVPSLKQYGASWVGGSVVPLHNQRAASLRYKLGNHRVTLYVFDATRVPIEKRLERRQVGDEQVYVGSRRGYSIGATDSRGVGYAVASDFNDAETAELVAALY